METLVEKITFAKWGFRVAVLDNKGRLELESDFNAEQYGGLIPTVGDVLCDIGPGSNDGRPVEVVKRFYVSEFGGETCWWLIARPVPVDEEAKAVFRLARSTAKANFAAAKRAEEERASDYEQLLDLRKRMAATTSTSKPEKGRGRTSLAADRPYTPETLAAEWSVSAQHIRDLIKSGALKHFRVGRLIRVSRAAVEEYKQATRLDGDSAG